MSGAWRARAAVLTLLGALAVHQGRYLAHPRAEDHHAHAYFDWLVPALAALTVALLVELGLRLALTRVAEPPALPPRRRLWLLASAVLLAIFGVQEAVEAAAMHGTLPTPAELAANGGWLAAPLAAGVGGALALLLSGAARVVAWARRRRSFQRPRTAAAARPRPLLLAPRASVIARRLAGRAPPRLA